MVSENRDAVKVSLGLSTEKLILLFNSSGNLSVLDLLEEIPLDIQSKLQIVVICYNEPLVELRAKQIGQSKGLDIIPLLWVQDMPSYQVAATLVFSKPGPGFLAEALAPGNELIIDGISPIMPQEIEVADHVISHGWGALIHSKEEFNVVLTRLVQQGRHDQSKKTPRITNGVDRLLKQLDQAFQSKGL